MTFRGHEGSVWCVAVVGGEELVISGGRDGVKVWDMEKGRVLRELEGRVDGLTA